MNNHTIVHQSKEIICFRNRTVGFLTFVWDFDPFFSTAHRLIRRHSLYAYIRIKYSYSFIKFRESIEHKLASIINFQVNEEKNPMMLSKKKSKWRILNFPWICVLSWLSISYQTNYRYKNKAVYSIMPHPPKWNFWINPKVVNLADAYELECFM